MDLSDGATIPSHDEVSEFLRIRRQGNRKKACFPCHQRKVGCDGSRPCKRCVNSGHPAMCNYEPAGPNNKKRRATSMKSATINSAQRSEETASINVSSTPASVSSSFSAEHIFPATDQFVGGSSVPGFIVNDLLHADKRGLSVSNDELRNVLLPALGLARTDCAASTESGEVTSALLRVKEALPRSSEVIRSVSKCHPTMTQEYGPYMSLGCSNNIRKSYILSIRISSI